jgi:hypothetical protein
LIILDTNVISALMQGVPEPLVAEWLDRQPAESVWITSITLFEARLGLALLPKGRRQIETAFEQVLADDLEGRVLDFDRAAAEAAARLAAERQRKGRPVDIRDTQIAGIVMARRAKFATRNIKHFAYVGAEIVNPWEAEQ